MKRALWTGFSRVAVRLFDHEAAEFEVPTPTSLFAFLSPVVFGGSAAAAAADSSSNFPTQLIHLIGHPSPPTHTSILHHH